LLEIKVEDKIRAAIIGGLCAGRTVKVKKKYFPMD
jgi:hypothetical protein